MARLLIHTLVFAPDGVSTAYLMTDLATSLADLGHEVTVLTTTPHYNLEESAMNAYAMTPGAGGTRRGKAAGVDVWHVPIALKGNRIGSRKSDYIKFHLRCMWLALAHLPRFDIVLAPSPPLTMGLLAPLIALRSGAPAVYNLQELYPDFAVNNGLISNKLFIRLMEVLERVVYRTNARIVPISDQFARTLRTRGVPSSKITMIPNFVDTSFYRPLPRQNEFAAEHGLLEEFVVLYAGNIGVSQDWESFLYAAQALSSRPICFAVSGDGVTAEWLRAETAKRGLVNVKFFGYLPRDVTPLLYASSDVGTIPMKEGSATDTFPSKVYTLFACGKPPVVSADRDSELERVIQSSGCGTVVPPNDPPAFAAAILAAFERRESLPAEGARGRAYVERSYSREAVAARYDDLIKELCPQS
ncbi:MAG: glycosyltransferase family 4 protein [Gemmatimonadaceae bacterium]|nr:glycosyltransferase family 4 protein [Gemmatimonadaceae bacterium]